MQFILPSKFRECTLEACHDEIGHLGLERSIDLLRDQFFWPSMGIDMEKKIKNCDRCLRFKAVPQKTSLVSLSSHTSSGINSHGLFEDRIKSKL